MSVRKQHAYEVALRMAQVKELRAQVALAESVEKERAAQHQAQTVADAQEKVSLAIKSSVAGEGSIDLARYDLLSQLSSALNRDLQLARHEVEQAAQHRSEKAAQNVMAKRHRERVHEHLHDVRLALAHARAAKALEEGVELWLDSRGEAP